MGVRVNLYAFITSYANNDDDHDDSIYQGDS